MISLCSATTIRPSPSHRRRRASAGAILLSSQPHSASFQNSIGSPEDVQVERLREIRSEPASERMRFNYRLELTAFNFSTFDNDPVRSDDRR